MNFFACPFSIFPIPEPETYALLPTGLDLTGVRAASATPARKKTRRIHEPEWKECFRAKDSCLPEFCWHVCEQTQHPDQDQGSGKSEETIMVRGN